MDTRDNEPSQIERRVYPVTETRVTRTDDGEPEKIRTTVAVFDSDSRVLGPPGHEFVERIEPGALQPADDVTSEVNHDPNRILGRTSAGTLEIEETREGVIFEVAPPDTSYARDVVESIDRGDVKGGSFAFQVEDDRWEARDDGPDLRVIQSATYFEGGPVTHPAYRDTSTELRNTEVALERRDRALEDEEREDEEPDETTEDEQGPNADLIDLAIREREAKQDLLEA